MPELPEVETVRQVLIPLVKGKKIAKVDVFFDKLVLSPLSDFKNKLIGETITDVKRYGKYLFIITTSYVIISHLRMEGKYRLSNEESPRRKHTTCIFYFEDGTSLCYDDTRKFGIMYLSNPNEIQTLDMIRKLGVEANNIPLSEHENLYKKFHKNKKIKELLLDQTILCGIGNIYADEILYASKINPFTLGKDLTIEDIENILKNAPIILDNAIKKGGSTIHSFQASEGVDGKFQEELLCYGREGEICPRCGTTFHKVFIGGRGTTFCPNCQINPYLEKAIGITGPIGSGKSTLLNHLKEKGYATFSCDEIIHELYKDNTNKRKISNILGSDFDIEDIEKKEKCRKIMVLDKNKKHCVEKYIYPKLEEKLIELIKTNNLIAIEVPLLFKAHFEYMFKYIFVITLTKDKQIKNLVSRGQENVEEYLKLNSDYHADLNNKKIKILENNGDLEGFFEKIDTFLS